VTDRPLGRPGLQRVDDDLDDQDHDHGEVAEPGVADAAAGTASAATATVMVASRRTIGWDRDKETSSQDERMSGGPAEGAG
jgi:hypothetical protein